MCNCRKQTGDGFVAHKAMLVNALSRTLADRVMLLDFTIGRKGLLNYLKALAGSNVIKIVPANGSASESQITDKKLKVICGANTSYLDNGAWINDKTPVTFAETRVSPSNSVKPNIGNLELSEALNRVLPFTAKDDARPVLQCVFFVAKEGKLKLVSADGFRMAVVTLDYDDGEGQALIHRDDLRGIASALRKAKRVRLGFSKVSDKLYGTELIIDTETIRYKWREVEGRFPNYEEMIPKEHKVIAHFDAVEAVKAVNSLKVLADSKDYVLDLIIGNGKVIMANPDDKGQAEIPADTEGEIKIRIDGSYLAQSLKACGGMVDLKLTTPTSALLFTVDGYQNVVMPIIPKEAFTIGVQDKPKEEVAEAVAEAEEVAEAVAEVEDVIAKAEMKPKRKRKAKEPVAVA